MTDDTTPTDDSAPAGDTTPTGDSTPVGDRAPAGRTGRPGFRIWEGPDDGAPLPPPPYPLWRVLFCSGCGEQFFGAHQFSGLRVYCTSCKCRPGGPVPADEVEKRTYAEVHRLVFDTDEVPGLKKVHYGRMAVRIFSRIEVGQTAEDLVFTVHPFPLPPFIKETN